jgi:hypothetical protein
VVHWQLTNYVAFLQVQKASARWIHQPALVNNKKKHGGYNFPLPNFLPGFVQIQGVQPDQKRNQDQIV